ncbi:MAG TPA: molybdopterin-dependent oxidoreductase, partial [Thermomicrobiales bacterium]|nr:molybdopterin-dependent oxidoreductase [Thermomicrobiales bacterium]
GANFRGLPPSAARVASALGLLSAYAAYAIGLVLTYRYIIMRPVPAERAAAEPATPKAPPPASEGTLVGRRAVVAAAAGAALAVPTVALIQRLAERAVFPYDGLTYSGPGVQPITPNDKFYTVTKNVVDPDVAKSVWRLDIGGLVAEPKQYGFADLTALPSVKQETTLMCISNRIGSGLFSNAVWTGVPLRELLAASRPGANAVEVLLHGADGYTDTFAFEKAMEPTTLVVYQMNGQPLPQRHGYPVRLIVPGLFGEKNVKWVTGIDVIDHDGKGFYEQQGWGPNFVVPTRSDFFSPKVDAPRSGFQFREPFRVGRFAEIRGRAFAGSRGVRAVEVSADDGETWRPARIDYPGTDVTWAFWTFTWRPTEPGTYHLVSRATDGTGAVQPPDRRGIVPQGATGYHRVLARVNA